MVGRCVQRTRRRHYYLTTENRRLTTETDKPHYNSNQICYNSNYDPHLGKTL